MEQLEAEVVETVAGVARLLRRAAELVWTQADAIGPRSSHQLVALGIDPPRMRHWAAHLGAALSSPPDHALTWVRLDMVPFA
jgi:hypothetical protein